MNKPQQGKLEQLEGLYKLAGLTNPPGAGFPPRVELAIVATALYLKGHITEGRFTEHLDDCTTGNARVWARFLLTIKEKKDE